MSKRLGVAGIVALIAAGIWVALPKHRGSSVRGGSVPVTEPKDHEAPTQPASTSTMPGTVATLDLWTRPPAKTAARHLRRARFAALRRFGASEQLVDRLTDGDALSVVAELKERAQRGDPAAANILADLGHSICAFASPKMQEGQAFPAQDTAWLDAALQDRIEFNKPFWAVCQSIDLRQVDGWVAKFAEQGNGASLFLSSLGTTASVGKQKMVEAADAGYPDAQASLAQILTHPPPDLAPGGPNDDEEKLFKQAAVSLPFAAGALALCEFNGCPGIEIDIPAAVSHAREAAQRGALEAMIEIGPQLQASMIDPTEVAAWNLVAVMLTRQGCSYGPFSIELVTAATNTLTAKKSFDRAKSLAQQYWGDYGSSILANIGCTS